eukprot:scaffold189362_cov21-Tisochrysis_lutea.AAC.1
MGLSKITWATCGFILLLLLLRLAFDVSPTCSDMSSSRQRSGFLTDSKGHSDNSAPEEVHSYEVCVCLRVRAR